MAHLLSDAEVEPGRVEAAPAPAPAPTSRPEPRPARRLTLAGDLLLYTLMAALVGGAWWLSTLGLFTSGDAIGYWLGVAGGVMLLLLFSYPLRKYVRWLHRWGQVKWWFLVHMALGIGGPLLILVHSTFRVGSTNAAVALYSMLIVAGSGVIGRFLYMRINRGLHGEAAMLRDLQARAGLDRSEAHSRLAFAPAVEARLLAFEQQHLGGPRTLATHFRDVLWLPLQQAWVGLECRRALKAALAAQAEQRGWSAAECAKRERQTLRLVQRYLQGVVRVAQLSAHVRLFALWHVAHVPFVYLMVVCAIVHVVAVHAY